MSSEKNIGKPCAGKLHARFDEEGLVKLPMEWLLRHRQTKGAETDKQLLMAIESQFFTLPCKFEVLILAELPCNKKNQLEALVKANERQAVDGAFKTPTLRNVGLNPPYFHNGGFATLESVVEFYNRGGNRRGHHQASDANDSSGTGPLGNGDPVANQRKGSNLDPDITNLELTEGEKSDLVAFLKALTDRRVACDMAPFDHPSLKVFNGHDGINGPDLTFTLPATGGTDGLQSCRPNSGDLFIESTALPAND